MHPADKLEDPYDASEEMSRLVELGYIEEPEIDDKKNVEKAVSESKYNLARAYIGASMYSEADVLLEALAKEQPDQSRFVRRLALCKYELKEFDKSLEIIAGFREFLTKEMAERIDKPSKEIDKEQIDDKELQKLEEEQQKDKLRLLKMLFHVIHRRCHAFI